MKTSLHKFISDFSQVVQSRATVPRRPGWTKVRAVAGRGMTLLVVLSLMLSSLPSRADDGMGMDGGMGGDYGGYDPGYGGYDPIDWGGIEQLIDPLINPGYEPFDPGPVEIPYEPYDPGYGGGYTPSYQPPTYSPPAYVPPTPPRNALPSGDTHRPSPPRNSITRRPARPSPVSVTPGYRVLPEGARPSKPPVNSLPTPAAKPAANEPAAPAVHPLTKKEIDKVSSLTQKATDKLKTELGNNKLTGDAVSKSVDGLAPNLPASDKEAVKKGIEEGRPDDVRKALEGKGVDPKSVEALTSMAAVNQTVDSLTKSQELTQQQLQQANQQIQNLGQQVQNLTNLVNQQQQQIAQQNQQIQNLTNAINQQQQQIQQLINGLNAQRNAINNLTRAVNQLIRNQVLTAILQRAIPGVRQVPPGPGVVVVRVPGMLPPGAVAPMGNGAVLAGPPMGQQGRQPPYAGPTSISTGSVLEAMGMPQAIGPAVKDSTAGVTSGIVLINKADAPVGFLVDSKSYSLEPSYYQAFRGAASGTVSFDRGNGETAKYNVTAGSYEFTATENGWELYRKTYKATIDNAHNPSDFQLVQGSETVLIPAGRTKELTSAYPVPVRFDDGTGQLKEKRLLDGTYVVASSGSEGALDLFEPSALQAAEEGGAAKTEPADREMAELLAEASPGGDTGALTGLSGGSDGEREDSGLTLLSGNNSRKTQRQGKIAPLLLGQ